MGTDRENDIPVVIYTDVDVRGGIYGEITPRNEFIPHGNAVEVTEVLQNIEDQTIEVVLEFTDRLGVDKELTWPLKDVSSPSKVAELSAYGVQVMPGKAANILCKVLSNSMKDADDKNIYYNVGWLNYKGKLIFRA